LAAAAADEGPAGQSKASLKRARQKEAAKLAAGASSSSSGPLVVAEAPAAQQPASQQPDDDDDDEARLVRQLVAVRAKKLSAAAVQAKMDKDADTDAEAAAAEVKGEGPNQFICVGPEPGSNANAVGPAGQGIGKRKAVILDEQRFKDSGRKVPVGRGMQAAKGKGKGKAEDPNQLACVGSNAAPDPESDYPSDLGGSSPFWPSRDLPEEEQMAAMKVLSCCSCAIGPLKRSDMVLWNDGRSASWQGKIFGWCRDCIDMTPQEFKSASRITWGHRVVETVGLRDRAYFLDFQNSAATIRSDFPKATNAAVRELAVKRHRIMCIAWASSFEKENQYLQEARRLGHAEWELELERAAADPTYGGSVDGRVLCARDISFLTSIADGIQLCFCCRNPLCLFFGMNSDWLQLGDRYKFRCPCCFDAYAPDSTKNGQVPFSFVLSMTDMETGKRVQMPAMWPPTQDMAWLNKQIEAFSIGIDSEVSLESYKARGKVELHELLAREAIPKEFVQVPFGSTPDADVGRVCWEPKWDVPRFQARGFVMGNKLTSADDLSHPYSDWNAFIAICGRITAEGRATSAKEVARLMSK
jgi:hypothetical protein